jgi:hypothetical protein
LDAGVNEAEISKIRSALVFILGGAFVEFFCLWDLTPSTFLGFACVGVPLILVGVAIFTRMVWRQIRTKAM